MRFSYFPVSIKGHVSVRTRGIISIMHGLRNFYHSFRFCYRNIVLMLRQASSVWIYRLHYNGLHVHHWNVLSELDSIIIKRIVCNKNKKIAAPMYQRSFRSSLLAQPTGHDLLTPLISIADACNTSNRN